MKEVEMVVVRVSLDYIFTDCGGIEAAKQMAEEMFADIAPDIVPEIEVVKVYSKKV